MDVKVFNIAAGSVTSGELAFAVATLTSDATAPSNNDTVTINGTVYTFKTALTGGGATAGEVLIGASAAAALDNLKSAVNKTAGGGTTYGSATVIHPTVEATTNTDTTQVFQAKTAGTAGNALTFAESSSHLSVSGATFAGGVDDTQTVTEGAVATATSVTNAALAALVAAGAVVCLASDTRTIDKLTQALRFDLGSYNPAGAEPTGFTPEYS